MTEVWRDIAGYEGFYQVSNLGRVRSMDRVGGKCKRKMAGRILKPTKLHAGYLAVNLCSDNTKKFVCVHRLVAGAFIDNPHGFPYVNHIDGNKENNDTRNLEWVTPIGNTRHAIDAGLFKPESYSKKRVVRDDGVVFESAIDAANSVNCAVSSMYAVLGGKRNRVMGHRFRYEKEGLT